MNTCVRRFRILLLLWVKTTILVMGFSNRLAFTSIQGRVPASRLEPVSSSIPRKSCNTQLFSMIPPEGPIIIILGDDDDDEEERRRLEELEEEEEEENDEEEVIDPYTEKAAEEFRVTSKEEKNKNQSALTMLNGGTAGGSLTTLQDWGGALGKLRQRVEDIESGQSQDPSHALFRLMSSETPNQLIGKFVTSANPQTVQAMTGAVSSLLGGLSNPAMGVETLIKASGEKIGSLCFQLQMTGYLFRNAEYVLALKDLLELRGRATIQDYKAAFRKLDSDDSGYIESTEIKDLFDDVYDGKAPQFEIDAFLQFFDQNKDGRISWDEFEKGLGAAVATQREKGEAAAALLGVDLDDEDDDDDDDDDDEDAIDIQADVTGTIEIELDDGKVVEVDAKDYVESLKEEARKLKEALRKETEGEDMGGSMGLSGILANGMGGGGPQGGAKGSSSSSMDITQYIASRQGDVKSLTEGISPEIVETMRRLVDFVLEGGDSGKVKDLSPEQKSQMEMELPGSALQQLALWQLVLGYRLREAEATGDYKRLLQ